MSKRSFPWFGVGLAAAAGAFLLRSVRRRYKLQGRVVLITGGSRGLGFELARHCVARGARVALLGRDADSLVRAAEQLGEGVMTFSCDVADAGAVRAIVSSIAER